MSGIEADRSASRDRSAWDAYAAAAVTGVVTGIMRVRRPELATDAPLAWSSAILYLGTLSLISLSTTDGRRRLIRFYACVAVVLLGMIAGAVGAGLLD